ncbi:MAG: filamentous hemagglutinin N-terminal domain-containing protein, partial [Steroidobacter sp.]
MNNIFGSTMHTNMNDQSGQVVKRSLRIAPCMLPLMAALLCFSANAGAQAVGMSSPAPTQLPTGGNVVAGTASITQHGSTMDVTQTTQRGVIDWQTFNVGSQAQVNFNQPNASAVTLNRIFDTQASQIFGHINANGQVFFSNPNGMYFSSTSSVDVGGLVATTHSIGVDDFMSGNYTFNRDGATGSVVNAGDMNAGLGGYIALLAPEVRNEGVLVAKMGTVALASGEAVTLNFDDNSLTGIVVQPSAIKALVENKGAVIAPGGTLILSAQALNHLQGGVVQNSGSLEATGLSMKDGRIVLEASDNVVQTSDGSMNVSGDHGGNVEVKSGGDASISGTVDAKGLSGNGGTIALSGNRVGVFDSASVDASGTTGGGNIFVGGGFHGQDPSISNAQQTVVSSGSTLKADAIDSGNGGSVAVWSSDFTNFAGNISAFGGSKGGNGGFVEVSGGNLNFNGHVDASAPQGNAGSLLLDPRDITVQTSGGSATTDVDQFTDTPSTDLTIDPATITAVTNAHTNVTLQANNDLNINSAIVTSAGGTGGSMTFEAGRSITVNATVISDNGAINFTANDSGAGSDRAAGIANFNNNSVIDAGSNNVSITMDTKSTSGYISSGHVAANNLTITHNGPTAGVNAVDVDPSNLTGAGAIDLGVTDLTGNLNITSNAARNLTNILGTAGTAGNVVVRGTTTINVGTGDVVINGANTDFNIIGLTAGNVTLKDTNAMRFDTTTLSGNLVEVTQGPMASVGAVQVGGTTNLTANTGGFGYADPYIDLTNGSNHFTGGVTLSVPSLGTTNTGGYAYIRDSGAITIASSNTKNDLQVYAGGAINVTSATSVCSGILLSTSTGAINTTTLNAGNWIQITTSNGTVNTTTTTAGSSLSVSATGAVDLGDTALGTDLTVSTGAAITDSGT